MEFVKLGDCISKQIKGMWGTEDSDELNGIPVIKTNNMTYEGNIDYSNICYRKIDKKKIGDNFLKEGDLLVEKSGGTKYHSVGYVNYFCGESNKFVCNNFIIGLRPDSNKIISKYLFYIIQFLYNTKQFADCFNQTTGIQNLQVETYLNKNIPLVDKSTQQKIVDVLDNINSLIKTKETELAQLDSLVQSQFAQMFGEIHSSNKYEYKKIMELCDVSSGGTPSRTKKEYWENGKINWVKTTELQNEKIYSTEEKITEKGLNNSAAKIMPKNTILIAMYGQGKTRGMTGFLMNESSTNQACACILPSEKINQFFLWQYLILSYEELRQMAEGSNQPNLNSNMIKNFPIIVPPIELQNKFASFVQQVDKTKSILNAQILQLKELLNSKMDEYFSC